MCKYEYPVVVMLAWLKASDWPFYPDHFRNKYSFVSSRKLLRTLLLARWNGVPSFCSVM